jgi:hypothetical protein
MRNRSLSLKRNCQSEKNRPHLPRKMNRSNFSRKSLRKAKESWKASLSSACIS